MSPCHTLLMDGTFYCCPKLLYQLFIINEKKQHTRSTGLLSPTWKNHWLQRKGTLKISGVLIPPMYVPKVVHADFEDAIHAAMATVWPSATRKGRRFHLGQSWYRRIQKLGLITTYIRVLMLKDLIYDLSSVCRWKLLSRRIYNLWATWSHCAWIFGIRFWLPHNLYLSIPASAITLGWVHS